MKIYIARTHQDFLTNLQMADKFQVSGHGALAGHTAKVDTIPAVNLNSIETGNTGFFMSAAFLFWRFFYWC